MKKLKEIILENLKDDIINKLNNSEFDENILKRISGILSQSTFTKEEIISWLKLKHCDDCYKALIEIILPEHDSKYIIDLLIRKELEISFDEFINSTNIYNIIQKKYNSIDIECLQDIADLSPSRHRIGRSAFEVLVQLLMEGNQGKGGGDIIRNDKGKIEIKGPEGRIRGQKNIYLATEIDKGIREYLKTWNNIDPQIDSHGAFSSDKSVNLLFKSIPLNDKGKFNLILYALIYQFNKDVYNSPIWENRIEYMNKIGSTVIKNGEVDPKSLRKLMGCIQLYHYQQHEDFSHIAIFKGLKRPIAIKNGDYKIFTADDIKDIVSMYNDDHLRFTLGGRIGGGDDAVCQIQYI